MKTGGIYLIKYEFDYYIIKILKILFFNNKYLVTFELICYSSSFKAYFSKGQKFLDELEKFFIKSLKRGDWYKLIREINEKEV